MDRQKSKSAFQVDEDRAWQEKFWTAQRVGWAMMALLVLVAFTGALGKGGPLASASARTPAGTVEYPRVTRSQSSEQIVVKLSPQAEGEVEVELSSGFLQLFTLRSIHPEPSQSEVTGEGQRFAFDVAGRGSHKRIVLDVRSRQTAFERTVPIRIGDLPPTPLRVTVLP